MTRETKAGLLVSCSFLCLVGIVLFSKLNDKEPNGTESPGEPELAQKTPAEPRAILPTNPGPSPTEGAPPAQHPGEKSKTRDASGGVTAEHRPGDELPGPATPLKEASFSGGSPNRAVLQTTAQQDPTPKEQAPSPAPVVNVPNESSTPSASGPMMGHSPPPPGREEAAPKEEKAASGVAQAHSPALPSGWPPAWPMPARTEGGTQTPAAGEIKAPAPVPPPDPAKSMTTPGSTAVAAAPGGSASSSTSGNVAETSDLANKGAKPATLAISAGPGPALAPQEGAATTQPTPGGTPTITTAPSPGPSNAETPKPAESVTTPPTPAPFTLPSPPAAGEEKKLRGDLATTDGTPKQEALPPTGTPPDRPKTMFHLADPPASAGDSKAPGKTEVTAAPNPAPTPTNTSPTAFSSSDPPLRSNSGFTLRPNPGPSGSSQDFATRPGTYPGMSSVGSPAADRDKPTISEPAPFRPTPSQAAIDGASERAFPVGTPTAPQRPSPTLQPPAASPPVFASGGGAPPRSLPPLGAPATSVSPPLAALVPSGSPPSSAGGILQVESYDESTYTCKAGDTLRTISQEFYRTDQYDRALLLFNRNHPLATDALRKDPPALQAGQPIYIPPARILEKYYGAPVSGSPPITPLATPSSRALAQAAPAGSVPPTGSFIAPPTISVRPLPPPGSVPLYRVHDGGEMLREIARRTLGDADRWVDIYRLNPRLDPREAIPGGSVLRLPRDARVDPQDIP